MSLCEADCSDACPALSQINLAFILQERVELEKIKIDDLGTHFIIQHQEKICRETEISHHSPPVEESI